MRLVLYGRNILFTANMQEVCGLEPGKFGQFLQRVRCREQVKEVCRDEYVHVVDADIVKVEAEFQRYIDGLQAEVSALKASESYRTGMFVTWPARKAWGGMKCLRENGVKYTVKHAVGKVLRRFGSTCKW